jgi:hypothetical protein
MHRGEQCAELALDGGLNGVCITGQRPDVIRSRVPDEVMRCARPEHCAELRGTVGECRVRLEEPCREHCIATEEQHCDQTREPSRQTQQSGVHAMRQPRGCGPAALPVRSGRDALRPSRLGARVPTHVRCRVRDHNLTSLRRWGNGTSGRMRVRGTWR